MALAAVVNAGVPGCPEGGGPTSEVASNSCEDGITGPIERLMEPETDHS